MELQQEGRPTARQDHHSRRLWKQIRAIFLDRKGVPFETVEGVADATLTRNMASETDALSSRMDMRLSEAIAKSSKLSALVEAKASGGTAGFGFAKAGTLALNKPQRVLVLRLKPAGKVSPDVCRMVTNLILTHLDGVRGLRAVGEDDIQAMLDVERRKDLLGCDSASCLAEIGGALGADLVVHGELGRLGTQYNVNLSIVDSKGASVRGRVSVLVDANEDAVVTALPGLTEKVVAKINAGGG